jgi:pSer/pThr/pTyr-binding forkhead associated (FHA) protein
MRTVTFLVLDGVDKGRVYRNLPIPVTIGREEGNALRLNDERVSRYHAKIQTEDGDVILTDLDSTNGTRVNGATVQIRRLRAGDQVTIGRSILLFGTLEEIDLRRNSKAPPTTEGGVPTIQAAELSMLHGRVSTEQLIAKTDATPEEWRYRDTDVPPLPQKMTGAQAARLAEVFDYLHRAVTSSVENIEANEEGTEIKIGFNEWQNIQAVQMLLARYSRNVAEPGGDLS